VISRFGRPKPDSELRGLVNGLGGIEVKGDVLVGDRAWYRSPLLLGGVALALSLLFYIPVW
jgi:SSS family solute:Na+ symporter